MRRTEGINFNQNNHVVIQNDGTNGQAGPQLMKAVYDMARKGAQDELRLQLRRWRYVIGEQAMKTFRWKVKPDMEVNSQSIGALKCVLVTGIRSVWRRG
ncbi:minor tail H domain protein [Escherichia coli B107]|nr:minor tail H domain protein [Escherichia coli B107]